MLRRLSAALPSIPKPHQSRSNSIAEPREEMTSPNERAESKRDSRPPTPVRMSTPVQKKEDDIDAKSEATSERLEDLNTMVKKEFQIIYRNIDRINDILNVRRRSTVTSAMNTPRGDAEVTFFDDAVKFTSQTSDFGWTLDERINNAVEIKLNQHSDQMTSLTSEIQVLKDQNQQILKDLNDPTKGGGSSSRDEEVAELKKDLQLMKIELSQLKLAVQQLTNSLEPNNNGSAFTAPIFPKKEVLRGNAKSESDDTPAKVVKPPTRAFETPVSKSGSEEKSNFNNGLRAMITNPMGDKGTFKSKDANANTINSTQTNHINDSVAKLQENIIQTSECQGINRIIQLSEKLNEIGPFTSLLRITVNVFKHFKCNKSAAREFILRLNHLCLILCEFIELTYQDSTSIGAERALLPEARASTDSHQIHAPAPSPPAPASTLAAVWSLDSKEQSGSNHNLRTNSNSASPNKSNMVSATGSIDATNGRFSIPISSERMQIIQQHQHLIQIELQKSLIILKELLHKTQKYFIIFNKFGFFTERLLHGYESRHHLRNFDLEFTNELINICSKFLKYQCLKDREYSIYIQKIDYAGKYTNFICDVEAIYSPNGKPSSEYPDQHNILGATTRIGSTLFDDPTAVILDAASSNPNSASSVLHGNLTNSKYEPLNIKDFQLLERLKSDLQMTQSDFITEIDYYTLYIEKKSHSFYYKLIDHDWNYYIIQHPALKQFWKLRFYNQNYIDKLFFLTNLYDYLVKYENCNIIYCEKLIKQLIPILDVMNEVYSSFIHDPLIHQQPQQPQQIQLLTNQGKYGKSNQVHSQPVTAPVAETVIDYKIDIFKMNQYTKYFPHHYTLQQLIEQLLIQVYPYQIISLPSSSSSKLLLDPPVNHTGEQPHQATNDSSRLLLELSIEKVEKSLFAPSSGISIVVGRENLGKSTTLLHYLHHTYLPNLLQRNHFYQHAQKLYHSVLWIDCTAFPLPSKIFTINQSMDAFAHGSSAATNQHFHDEYSDELLFSLLQYLNDYFSFGILCTEREWEQLRSSSDTPLSQYPLYQELRNFFNLVLAKQRKLNTKDSSSQLAESKVTLVFDNIRFVQIMFFSPLWSILSEFIDHFHIIFILSKPNSPGLPYSITGPIDSSTEKTRLPSQVKPASRIELIDRVRNELIQYFGDVKTVNYRDYRYEEFIVSYHNNNQEISTKIESYLLSLNNAAHHSAGFITDGNIDTNTSTVAESPQFGSTVSYLSQYCSEICNIFQYHPILISMFSPYFTEEIIIQLVQDLIIYEQGQAPLHSPTKVVGASKPIKSSQSFVSVKPFISALKEQLLYYFLSINDIIILFALIPLVYLPNDPKQSNYNIRATIPSLSSNYHEGEEDEESDAEEAEERITVSEEMIYYLVKDAFPKSNENMILFKECLERLTQFQIITKVTSSTASSFLNNSYSVPNEAAGGSTRGAIGSYTEYVIDRKNLVLISFFDYITVQNRFHSQFAKQTTLVNRLMSIYNSLKQWIERQPSKRILTLNDDVSLHIYQTSLKNYYEYIDHHYLYPVYKLLVYHGNYIFTTLQTPSSSDKNNNNNSASVAAVPNMNLLEDISTNDTITSTLLPPSNPAAMNFPLQQNSINSGASVPSVAISDNNYCLNDLILLLYAMRHRYHIHQYLGHFFHHVQSLHHHRSTTSTPTPPPPPAATVAPVVNSFSRGKSQTTLSGDKHQINYFEEKNHVLFLTKAMEYLGKFFFTTHITRKVYLYLFTYFFYFPSTTAAVELNSFSDFIHQIREIVVKSSTSTSLATGSLKPIEISLLAASAPTPTSAATPIDEVKDVLMQSNSWQFQPLYRYYLVFVLRNLADLYLGLGAKAAARPFSPGVDFQESVSSAASLLHVSEGALILSPAVGVEEVIPASEISELILLTLFHVAESSDYSAEMQECVTLSTQEDLNNPLPPNQPNSNPSSGTSSPLPENPVGRRMSIMRQRQSILSVPTPAKKEESNNSSSLSTSSPRRVVITKVEVEVEKSKLFHVMSKIFLQLQKYAETLLLYEKAMQTMQALYTSHHNDHTEAVAAWLFGHGAMRKEEDLFAVYESSHKEEVPDTVSPLANNKREKDSVGKKKGVPSSLSSPTKPTGRKGGNGKPPVGIKTPPSSTAAAMPYTPSTPAPTIPSNHIPNIHEFHQLVDIGILFYNIAAIQHSMKSYVPSIQHYSQALKVFQHCQQYLQWSNKLISSQRRITAATSSNSSANGASTSDMIFIPSLTQSNSAAPSTQPQQHNPRRPSVGGGIEQYYSDQKQHQISLQSHYYSKHIITKIAKTLHCLSTVYYEQNAYSRSLQTSIKLLSYYSQIYGQDHALIANLYHTIGNLSVLTNQKKESIKYYEKALKIYQKVSEQSLIALGKSDHHGHHHPSAHDLIHTTHHEEEIAIIFYHLGNVYKSLYMSKESIRNYDKAKNIYKQLLIHAQQIHLQNYSQLSQQHHQMQLPFPSSSLPPLPNSSLLQRPFTVQLPSNSSVASSSGPPPAKSLTINSTRQHPNAVLYYQNIMSEIQRQIESL